MANFNNPFDALNALSAKEILALTAKPHLLKDLGNEEELMGYVGRVVAPTGQRAIFEDVSHAIAALTAYAAKNKTPLSNEELRAATHCPVSLLCDKRLQHARMGRG